MRGGGWVDADYAIEGCGGTRATTLGSGSEIFRYRGSVT